MLSARTRLEVIMPNGDSVTLRATTEGQTPPTCAACGSPAPFHIFRPTFGCRCAACVEMLGKADNPVPEGRTD